MVAIDIPQTPAALTAEWLSAVLGSSAASDPIRVSGMEPEPITVGHGFVGQVYRLRLQYASGASGAPASLIAKFPAADTDVRKAMTRDHLYEREARFYEYLATDAGISTPRCYYSGFDPASGDALLLLEDLGPGCTGDNVVGCTRDHAEVGVRALARFHAKWWGHPQLPSLHWMPVCGADGYQMVYRRLWDRLAEQFGETLPEPIRSTGTALRNKVAALRKRLGQPPWTIVHGDFRLDNLAFSDTPGRPSPVVLDWQLALRGRGVADLAYFLVYSLQPVQRLAWEGELLHGYHQTVAAAGVRGYSLDDCYADYRLGMLHNIIRTVMALMLLDFSSPRAQLLAEAFIQRTNAAVADHAAGELLAGL